MNKSFDVKPASRNIVDLKTPHHFTKQSGAGFQPPLKRPPLKRSGSKRFFTALLVLLFLIISATVAGFFIFYNNSSSNDSIKLSLSTPKNLSSGEELTLTLAYENLDKVPLQDIEVVAQYPQGFFFDRANLKPTGEGSNIWQLPDLAVGAKGKIEVAGQLIGKINEAKEFKITFYYQPANFNSSFKTELKADINISDVLFEVKVESPQELLPGDEANFKISYKNATAEAMNDLKMSFDLGDNFILSEARPTTSAADLRWSFEKIEAGSSGEINFKGKFKEGSGGAWQFKVWQNVLREGLKQERLFYQEAGTIAISSPALKINLESENKQPINFGDKLVYRLTMENSGQAKVVDGVLQIKLDGNLIDWEKFDNALQATRKNQVLEWTKESGEIGKKLAEILPGAKESIKVELPLTGDQSRAGSSNPEDFMIRAQVNLTYSFAGKIATFSSEPLVLNLAGKPQLTTEARYYLDQKTKVGQGPLPPTVGQETRYRVYWKIFAGSSGLSLGQVKTTLPSYLKWVGKVDQSNSADTVDYNETSRQISWQWQSAPSYGEAIVSFDLAVTPTASQVNQLLILTNPTTLESQEQATNNVVTKTANLLTSDLVGDPVAQGKGRVVVGK